ncbi:MAG: hypothetical protein ACI959_000123, partial [Limisphaerales bacterium]
MTFLFLFFTSLLQGQVEPEMAGSKQTTRIL